MVTKWRSMMPALLLLILPIMSLAQEGDDISANVAPPDLPVYEQPPIPGDGYLWTPGYWCAALYRGSASTVGAGLSAAALFGGTAAGTPGGAPATARGSASAAAIPAPRSPDHPTEHDHD
ncbi:MAG: hypothetical protein ACLP6Z_08620 [Steroidobacteraceae bacterium]